MAVLRCTHCRMLVDVAPASTMRCAACGGPLDDGVAEPSIWDDDPTERRPIDYPDQLARRHKR